MTQAFDVVILGGGIVGLTTALAMASREYSVAIVDAGSLDVPAHDTPDSRVYAINHASKILFETLGIWQRINPSRFSPYEHMHVWDSVSTASIDFDARMVADNALGMIMEESVIKYALLQAIEEKTNIHRFGQSKVTDIVSRETGVEVISEGGHWQGKLLIGADGANSLTRQLLSIPITTWPYHHHAIIASVATESAHQKTAYQIFHPEGPLAFLPLVDNHQCSIVWSTSHKQAEQLMALDDADFNQALGKAFANRLGEVKLIGKRHQFPLVMRHTKQYVGNHWLLMGDAAHTIHPLAGLGLNIGLADVTAWLSCLDNQKKSQDVFDKRTLGAYQRQRKHAVWKTIALLSALKSMFSNPFPPVVALRGLGLGLCNQSTMVKRMFIEHASGG